MRKLSRWFFDDFMEHASIGFLVLMLLIVSPIFLPFYFVGRVCKRIGIRV